MRGIGANRGGKQLTHSPLALLRSSFFVPMADQSQESTEGAAAASSAPVLPGAAEGAPSGAEGGGAEPQTTSDDDDVTGRVSGEDDALEALANLSLAGTPPPKPKGKAGKTAKRSASDLSFTAALRAGIRAEQDELAAVTQREDAAAMARARRRRVRRRRRHWATVRTFRQCRVARCRRRPPWTATRPRCALSRTTC